MNTGCPFTNLWPTYLTQLRFMVSPISPKKVHMQLKGRCLIFFFLKKTMIARREIDSRFMIAIFIGIGIYGAITISQTTLERYNENPTVISMDRNMFFWNTSFPSLTICPHKKLNDLKLNKYIEWVVTF